MAAASKRTLLTAILLILTLSLPLVAAETTKPKKILALLSYHLSLPWTVSYMEGIVASQHNYGNKIEIYSENMESVRLANIVSDAEWIAYLQTKYARIHIDAIVTESDAASIFVEKYGRAIFGDIPFVFYTDFLLKKSVNFTDSKKIMTDDAVKNTVRIALEQNPNVKNIVIIDGQNPSSEYDVKKLKKFFQKNRPDLRLTILKDFTLQELEAKIAKLSPKTIVFYTLVFHEKGSRKQLVPKEVVTKIADISPAPVYSFYSPFVNTGVIGGNMIDGKAVAEKSIDAAVDLLNDETNKSYLGTDTFIDWNAMQRYGLDTKTIDKNAIIVNKPKSILENYFEEVIAAIITISVLFILLVFVVILNIQRKKLIHNLKTTNTSLIAETERRIEKERLLIQQSKMAAMGEMISAISHQWKQPLNIISLLTFDILERVENGELDKSSAQGLCEEIANKVNYMSQTITDFRNFFKPDKVKKVFSVKNNINFTLGITNALLQKHGIQTEITGEDHQLTSIPNELQQVVLNLISNAKDALIQNETENPKITIHLEHSENRSIIEISDNAGGIPQDISDKIFQPYFSTKGEKGTGIGLYMSRLIVEESLKGNLSFANTNHGATFRISLPDL